VTKGDQLRRRGPLEPRTWTGQDGVERTDLVLKAWIVQVHRGEVAGTGGRADASL
jgi:single-stranded DNA-binding protein